MSSVKYTKFLFFKLLENERKERWDRINARFAVNDDPAGCKLMATGCMERFVGPRDEERMSRERSVRLEERSSREEWLEKERLRSITPDMSLSEITAVLNPKEKFPWE